MLINGVEIEDTFAEAFGMWGSRLIITGANERWARTAAEAATGLATSIIGCGCEAGVNRLADDEETPDGRPGVAALFFTVSRSSMEAQLLTRVGQAVMTCTSSACYDGLEAEERLKIGGKLRYFGDGFQMVTSPQTAARKAFQLHTATGKLKALMTPTMPIGCHCSYMRWPGRSECMVLP